METGTETQSAFEKHLVRRERSRILGDAEDQHGEGVVLLASTPAQRSYLARVSDVEEVGDDVRYLAATPAQRRYLAAKIAPTDGPVARGLRLLLDLDEFDDEDVCADQAPEGVTSLGPALVNTSDGVRLWHPGSLRGRQRHSLVSALVGRAAITRLMRWGPAG